jgi:hypothetical protein
MSRMRADELIAHAEAERRARPGRPVRAPQALRLAALRMLARGLRVEREVEFNVARAPEC